MKKAATSKNALFDPAFLPHLADLIDDGEITVGVVEPVGCVATAVDGSNCLAMLVRRDGETLAQLITRLDLAVGSPSQTISSPTKSTPRHERSKPLSSHTGCLH